MNPQATAAWQALAGMAGHYLERFDLRSAFADHPQRFERLSLRAPYMLADLSKNLWDERVLEKLLGLADQCGLAERRDRLLSGGIVNDTEQRPAGHAVLRSAFSSGLADNDAMAGYCRDIEAMLDLADVLRNDANVRDIVHIGIGGSGLGPELAVQALHPYKTTQQRLHFVSNLDGHDLCQTLQGCEPAHTHFIVASKSWTTVETLQNARSAMAWLLAANQRPASRMVAITAKPDAAAAMGLQQTLTIPQDIGGRFSIWSSVGLPVAIAIGRQGFKDMLAGASAMDRHFAQSPLSANLPVWLGLLDVWYSSFLHMPSRSVAPYHHGLRRLPAYLQQLDMESNGKRVRRCGSHVSYPTAIPLWGEAGTNGQHAFFQWLHQGTQRIPVEFVAAVRHGHTLPEHQDQLLVNALAQAQALMCGGQAGPEQLPGHQDFEGNKPSTFVLLDKLTPSALGALLALNEHRVFVSGTVWGINSFDQWGVELGKRLASDILQRLHTNNSAGLDASTAGLLQAALSEQQDGFQIANTNEKSEFEA